MTIVDFCHSEHGRGIKQAKLYRRLRRWVETHIEEDLYEAGVDIAAYGFEVEEDEAMQLRYEIYNPGMFRPLALYLARSEDRMLTVEEEKLILAWLEQMAAVFTGQDESLVLANRRTMERMTVRETAEWMQVLRLIEKIK